MKLALCLLSLLTLCPLASAGGFDPRRVPVDARWVTHIDFEALDRSKFLRALAEQGVDFTREFDLDRVQQAFGIDPCKDLTGLTFFNCSKSECDFVVVVEARPSVEGPWARLSKNSREAHGIGTRAVRGIGTDTSLFIARVNDARSQPPLFVLATSEAGLAAALPVLDGAAPNLSAAAAPGITAKPSAGAIVFAAGSARAQGSSFMARALGLLGEFAALERAEADLVVLNTQGLVFEFGEQQNDLHTRLELNAPAAQGGEQVAQVLRVALARVTKLASGSDAVPQIERLTRAVRIEVQGACVRATFRYDAAGFVNDVLRSEQMLGVTKAR